MAAVTYKEIARAIYLAVKDKTKNEQADILKNSVNFLYRKRLLSKSANILAELVRLVNEDEGRVVARVESPEKIDSRTLSHLAQTLKKRYQAKEVIFEEDINKELIGGMRVEVGDEVMDLSVKNRLGKLKAHLIQSA